MQTRIQHAVNEIIHRYLLFINNGREITDHHELRLFCAESVAIFGNKKLVSNLKKRKIKKDFKREIDSIITEIV
ncbi:hypothetical protein UA32_12345 [Photobacterium angustum]|uniref:Uncharacterized protein n=1 Tax=Photobacterium angustum TaxID=661 RepID=A0ABX5GZG3_PHOAN|nr:hypothetical protein UA32_12345 [Photobacterium angustum]PSX03925.1 hypothetical protein C0W27_20735 [Photobacterium angustum]